MRPKHSLLTLAAVLSLLTLSAPAGAAPVSAEDLLGAQANAGEWLTYGRNYLNQRFSPLDKITKENAARLKPVFAYSTGGKFAGLEATPLFHDGTLYFSGDYSRVFALDARTGTLRWYWEPEYEEGLESILCCGPVNRGLAIHGDKVFVGTLDARLVALNARAGRSPGSRRSRTGKRPTRSPAHPWSWATSSSPASAAPNTASAASCRPSKLRRASPRGRRS